MTKLEKEKYLLSLNDGQRLALLLTMASRLVYTNVMSLEEFEAMMAAYKPKEKTEKGE